MKRLVLALVASLTGWTTMAHAEVKDERIEYKVGDTLFTGVLAYDDTAKDKRPGVLVCHEWWGCNEYMERRVRMLADEGYIAFAPDMYGSGRVTSDPKQASAWLGELFADQKAMVDRAGAGLKILADHPRTDPAKLAAIGYCMGGTVALTLARSDAPHAANLKAIATFHTSNISAKDPASNGNIKGSVLVCHGAIDSFVQPAEIEKFHKQMDEAKVDYQFISYSGALHAFTNPGADKYGVEGVKYQQAADKRSWKHMLALFEEKFGTAKK